MSGNLWIGGLDFETTGFKKPAPVSVAVVRIEAGKAPVTLLHMKINPGKPIEPEAQAVHGIRAEDVADAPLWPGAVSHVLDALQGAAGIAAHSAAFDSPILFRGAVDAGLPALQIPVYCTKQIAKATFGSYDAGGVLISSRLVEVAARLGVNPFEAHDAEADATAVALMLPKLVAELARRNPSYLAGLPRLATPDGRLVTLHEALNGGTDV